MAPRVIRLLAVTAAAVMIAVLAGCTAGAASGSASTAPASAAASASASASPSATASATAPNLPTDCGTLATPDVREAAIGDLTLQSDGSDFVRPVPAGASLVLGCDWIVGDATGMLLLVSTATPAAVAAAAADLPADGYTCDVADDAGEIDCALPDASGDPNTEQRVVARDGVWIYLSTSNRDGTAFLSDIVDGVFG